MEILNFKQFFTEAEQDASNKGADFIGSLEPTLGIEKKDIPKVLKPPTLMVNTLVRRNFPKKIPLQVAITPVSSEPKFLDGKFVGAKLDIDPDEAFPYVYLNKTTNRNRFNRINTSTSANSYDKLMTTGLQPS
jgi:hypothetical protein